ncbi:MULTISPECIES: hypothetical protein [unclassified Microcoleus]|uniref:hypothetical protein n=1 Tax=unclassified Microcoleus TaxID=2642155 RepID=UPI002FD5ABA0
MSVPEPDRSTKPQIQTQYEFSTILRDFSGDRQHERTPTAAPPDIGSPPGLPIRSGALQ